MKRRTRKNSKQNRSKKNSRSRTKNRGGMIQTLKTLGSSLGRNTISLGKSSINTGKSISELLK